MELPSNPSIPASPVPPYRPVRIQEEELLDHIPAAQALPNMADLARINRLFGGYRTLRARLRALLPQRGPLRILDVAAASTETARWLRKALPGTEVTSSDIRHDLLQLGGGDRVAADALRLPFRTGSFDVAVCTLFLHHLSGEMVCAALREMHRVSTHGVVAVDLLRHPIAYHFLRTSRPLFGWHPVTLEDGRRSVQAAFSVEELRDLLRQAGFVDPAVRAHHPWFRLSVTLPKAGL